MQLILEGGDHAQIAAAAAQAPKQILVFHGAGGEQPPVGGDHVSREEIVNGKSVLAGQPSKAAPEGKSGDARIGGSAARGGQPKGLRLTVEFEPLDSRLRPSRARGRIHTNGLHGREVDNDATVADGVTWKAVPSPAHSHLQFIIAGEVHGANDIGSPGAASDHGWPAVKHPIPYFPRLVVAVLAGTQQGTSQTSFELFHGRHVSLPSSGLVQSRRRMAPRCVTCRCHGMELVVTGWFVGLDEQVLGSNSSPPRHVHHERR